MSFRKQISIHDEIIEGINIIQKNPSLLALINTEKRILIALNTLPEDKNKADDETFLSGCLYSIRSHAYHYETIQKKMAEFDRLIQKPELKTFYYTETQGFAIHRQLAQQEQIQSLQTFFNKMISQVEDVIRSQIKELAQAENKNASEQWTNTVKKEINQLETIKKELTARAKHSKVNDLEAHVKKQTEYNKLFATLGEGVKRRIDLENTDRSRPFQTAVEKCNQGFQQPDTQTHAASIKPQRHIQLNLKDMPKPIDLLIQKQATCSEILPGPKPIDLLIQKQATCSEILPGPKPIDLLIQHEATYSEILPEILSILYITKNDSEKTIDAKLHAQLGQEHDAFTFNSEELTAINLRLRKMEPTSLASSQQPSLYQQNLDNLAKTKKQVDEVIDNIVNLKPIPNNSQKYTEEKIHSLTIARKFILEKDFSKLNDKIFESIKDWVLDDAPYFSKICARHNKENANSLKKGVIGGFAQNVRASENLHELLQTISPAYWKKHLLLNTNIPYDQNKLNTLNTLCHNSKNRRYHLGRYQSTTDKLLHLIEKEIEEFLKQLVKTIDAAIIKENAVLRDQREKKPVKHSLFSKTSQKAPRATLMHTTLSYGCTAGGGKA